MLMTTKIAGQIELLDDLVNRPTKIIEMWENYQEEINKNKGDR